MSYCWLRAGKAFVFLHVVVLLMIHLMVTGASAQAPTPSLPNQTLPNQTLPNPIPPNQKTKNADEAAVFERISNRVRFENDGTSVSETEAVVRIQSQAGVEDFGQLVFKDSSATEKLEVEYVRVRKPDGRVVVTPDSTAQDF